MGEEAVEERRDIVREYWKVMPVWWLVGELRVGEWVRRKGSTSVDSWHDDACPLGKGGEDLGNSHRGVFWVWWL